MYIDRNRVQEYPFTGIFYRTIINDNAPLDQQKETKEVLFSTKCDIIEASHTWGQGTIWAQYAVYFPFEKDSDIKVKLGTLFESDMYGLKIDGKVVGVFPSQLGGMTVYIRDMDI
jgi:hypothetical protein